MPTLNVPTANEVDYYKGNKLILHRAPDDDIEQNDRLWIRTALEDDRNNKPAWVEITYSDLLGALKEFTMKGFKNGEYSKPV